MREKNTDARAQVDKRGRLKTSFGAIERMRDCRHAWLNHRAEQRERERERMRRLVNGQPHLDQ